MNRRCLLTTLSLVTLAAAGTAPRSAAAASGTVAVLPAAIVNSAAPNGPKLTGAMEAVLKGKGLRPLDATLVTRAVSAAGMNLAQPQPLNRLAALGKTLKADYVVYTRVLSVGKPINARNETDREAVILVNVVDVATARIKHTYQSSVGFSDASNNRQSLIPDAAAREAAEKMLAAFLKP